MLALTYPDGARVQCCDYLPENPPTSSPLIYEGINSCNEFVADSNSRKNYASRFRARLRGGVTTRRKNDTNENRAAANVRENFPPNTQRHSSLPLREVCKNEDGFECGKRTEDPHPPDELSEFPASSQSEKTRDHHPPRQRFSIFNVEDKSASHKNRRRELPGRESWPGGSHPKDRCFLHLILILLLIIIGSNRHSGPLGPRVNRTAFGVFAFGTAVGQARCAPVDIVTDTGVRSERSANLSHITGTSRKIQMYIKHRHLQILPDGTVNGSNDDTSDFTVLQRTSVSRGQLRIQGVATCLYLCMDSCGLLYGSREYTEDCVFNETLEQHNYNTYSSAHWSTPRKTLYLGLSGRGQPRRVQAKGHNLGRLSAYARVLTQVVAQDRVEALHRRMTGARHGVRHHHGSQQTVCPAPTPQEKDGRDKFRCRKRKKRKKRRRKCRAGEIPGVQCDPRDNGASFDTQSKRSCEGAALDEACRREALDASAKKRKSRIEEEDLVAANERGGDDEVDDIREEEDAGGNEDDGKSRRSNERGGGQKKKGKKSPPNNQGAKKSGGNKRKKSHLKNDRNVAKSLRKKGGNRPPGRFARTTYRLSSSPAVTSPLSLISEPTGSTILEKSGIADSGLFKDRPKSLSSSSSTVSAVSLAATSLASTLTIAVASAEVFSEDGTSAPGNRTDGVLDFEEFGDLKDFDDDEEEERVDDEDHRDEPGKDFENFAGLGKTEVNRRLAM